MQVELKENSLAPSFQLPSSRERDVSLEDFRGKNLVLYFYPKDSTPGCTIEANQFSNKAKEFESFNTVIVGVSKDSIKSHKNFIEKQCIKFELLSGFSQSPSSSSVKQIVFWSCFGSKCPLCLSSSYKDC